MNSVEIKDKIAQLKKRANEICDTCKAEIRDFNESEVSEIDKIKIEITDLNSELRKLEDELSNNNQEIKNKTIMTKEFRLIKAINDVANNRTLDNVSNAVIGKGAEEMRKAGLSFGGQIQLPIEERATISVANEGEDVVETNFTNILEPLRAKNVLIQAGAKYLGGLTGDVQVPLMNGSNVSWEGETAPAKDGAGTFSNVKLQPKRLTAYIDVSKQFLVQDSLDAENLIKQDIVNAINTKLESTILGNGEGSATMPQGIFYVTDEPALISDFADICEMESAVEDTNVNGSCSYVMSNKAKAVLRSMIKGTNNTGMIMEHGEIDGTPVYNTSNVINKGLAYGDFSNLVIAQWGGIDLTVDPYTKAADGQVRLVINCFFDAKVVRPEAIVIARVS